MKMSNCQLNITKPILSKQKGKKFSETRGIIKPVQVLKHENISRLKRGLKEAEVVHCGKFISYKAMI